MGMNRHRQSVEKRWSREVITDSMRWSAIDILSFWSMGILGLALLGLAFSIV